MTSSVEPRRPCATVAYTYDHNGNRLTKTEGGTTTTYTYDAAGELTSDGTNTYAYDANGNLTSREADAFSYDWASRMTAATVGGTSTAYAYNGDGVRTSKTVGGGTPVNYLWDEQSGLPLLVDDGATSYLQANGAIADIDASGTPAYHLADTLGSTRGLADSSGSVIGTADYDVFGASRAASSTSSALGFTGQQTDAETGFVFLRARYLNPSLGRFTTVDSVQPNAPGTQGFNLYAYVANNPTTWVDPSGHMSEVAAGLLLSEAGQACFTTGWCEDVLLPLVARVSVGGLIGIGGGAGIAFIVLACVLNDECRGKMVEFAEMVAANGSSTESTPSGSPATAPTSSISVPDPTAGIYNTAKGNVADTGIAQEAQDIIDAAIERGERPPDRCEALAMLHEKYAKEKNSVKRKKVETTQKAWGCRGSRFGKGGRTPGGGGIID